MKGLIGLLLGEETSYLVMLKDREGKVFPRVVSKSSEVKRLIKQWSARGGCLARQQSGSVQRIINSNGWAILQQ